MRKLTYLSAALILTAVVLSGCKKERTPVEPPRTTQPSRLPDEPTSEPAALSAPPVESEAIDAAHRATVRKLINGGLNYLLARREADGGWSMGGAAKPAVTAMALKVLLQHPDFDSSSVPVKRGFKVLLSYCGDDGGIYDRQSPASYTTAVAVMAIAAAQDPQYTATIREAVAYLKGLQIVPGSESPDGGTVAGDDPAVGGVGYGKNDVPNLSVLGMVMDAWHEAGVPADDEAVQLAVGFLSRLQNRSESNPMPFAKVGVNDGGFTYDLKSSKAGPGPGGRGLRSYGSMTYVGFKSLLYANVARDDPRVSAAYDWIRTYWRLDSNPNMPQTQSQQGLYYYYHVFAKALQAWDRDVITDTKGVKHNWRHELIDALAERVRKDGSWFNEASPRWLEGDPVLVSCYSVLALQEAAKK